jgi:hypothetical protein
MMNSTKNNCIPILLFSVLVWIGTSNISKAQDSQINLNPGKADHPHIEWLMNWTTSSKIHPSKRFKDHLNAILFGIKLPALSNPVSIVASNPDDLWILDQGNKTIFQVQKKLGHIPPLHL